MLLWGRIFAGRHTYKLESVRLKFQIPYAHGEQVASTLATVTSADTPQPESPATAGHVVRQALLDIGPSLGAYYGLRASGVSELHALIAATLVAAAQTLYKVIRNRKFDFISGFLMLNFGLSLIIAFTTNDPRMAQVSNTIPGVLLALFFIGSALFGKPFTELIVSKTRGDRIEQLMAEQNWTEADKRAYHRMHVTISFWFGVISLLLSVVSIAIIYSFSVDVAQGINQIFSLVTTIGLIIGMIVVVRRYLGRLAQGRASA